jgi:hypothetical protein
LALKQLDFSSPILVVGCGNSSTSPWFNRVSFVYIDSCPCFHITHTFCLCWQH